MTRINWWPALGIGLVALSVGAVVYGIATLVNFLL